MRRKVRKSGARLRRGLRQATVIRSQDQFISSYATAHPWEDFAETWAHYLHIVDTLEIARPVGMSVNPSVSEGQSLTAEVDFDPHRATDIHHLVDTWLSISFAVNSLNRAMGQPDLYPFILSPAVIEKLGFINQLLLKIKRSSL